MQKDSRVVMYVNTRDGKIPEMVTILRSSRKNSQHTCVGGEKPIPVLVTIEPYKVPEGHSQLLGTLRPEAIAAKPKAEQVINDVEPFVNTSEFESIGDIADKYRVNRDPKTRPNRDGLAYFYKAKQRGTNGYFRFSIGASLVGELGWKHGDRIDILWNQAANIGVLKKVEKGGYCLSFTNKSKVASIRCTYYPEMKMPTEDRVTLEHALAPVEGGVMFQFPVKGEDENAKS